MKNIIITGVTSFLGIELCKELIKYDYKIYAVMRSNSIKKDLIPKTDRIVLIEIEMKDYDKLNHFILEKCDVGITLAWNGTRGKERDDVQQQFDNYLYSKKCIESFIELGCDSIITAGSQAEYGPWYESRKITEDDICNPNTEYGKNKLRLYQVASTLCKENGVRLIEPRFFSLYGPNDYQGTMVISVLINMLRNESCKLTQCKQLWDFLYIDDAINGLIKLIQSKNAKGVYNFGSGYSAPLKEYIEIMLMMSKSKSTLLFGAIPYPQTGMVNTNPDVNKLKSEMEWTPQVSFEEGIRKVIEHILPSESNI